MTHAQALAATDQGEIVDQLVKIDTARSLTDATMRHVRLVDHGKPVIELEPAANGKFPTDGAWESSPRETDFPFTEMLPSWNVTTPAGTGVRFFVRVRDAENHEWSPWLYVGNWGSPAAVDRAELTTEFTGGKVDIDTVKLSRPANAWQMRAALEAPDGSIATPRIRRMSIVYSGRTSNQKIIHELLSPVPASPAGVEIDLPVPYRAQHDTPEEMRHQVCSPTSVTMVLAYWGKDIPTEQNCRAIWDSEYGLYGNWNRAVARAGELGFDAWLTRFRNWQQVRATLATGQPIIASIRFNEGEFPSSVLNSTDGHLIVIRGMTAGGDAICNDPANRERGNRAIYKADELGRAWFGHGGVAYIIHSDKRL